MPPTRRPPEQRQQYLTAAFAGACAGFALGYWAAAEYATLDPETMLYYDASEQPTWGYE